MMICSYERFLAHHRWCPTLPFSVIVQMCCYGTPIAWPIKHMTLFLRNIFGYRTGGWKFRAYFSCTTMHAARVVFYLVPSGLGNNPAWQSCYHRQVDISGATDTEFTIPFPFNTIIEGFTTTETSWALYMSILSFSQPVSTATTPIYLMLYMSSAEDVEYFVPRDVAYTFTPLSFPRKDFSTPFEPLHASMRAYRQEKIVMGNPIRSMKDLFHILWPQTTTSGASVQLIVPWTYAAANTINGMNLFNLLFLFCRGSLRVKTTQKVTNPLALFVTTETGHFWQEQIWAVQRSQWWTWKYHIIAPKRLWQWGGHIWMIPFPV